MLLSVSWGAVAASPCAGRSSMGRIGLLAWGRISIVGNIIAGQPEPHLLTVAAAVRVAADNSVSATVSTTFVVGFETTLIIQGGALLPRL